MTAYYTLNLHFTRTNGQKSVYAARRFLPPHDPDSLAMTEAILDRQGLMLNRVSYFYGKKVEGNTEWWIEQV